MKVVFFGLKDWHKSLIKKELKKYKPIFVDSKLTPQNASKYKSAEIICTFIYSQVTEEILEKLPNLKYLVTMSTGFDHIDRKACQKRKIKVSNIPNYGEDTVAEHTFALILSIARNVHKAIEQTKKNNFEIEGLMGFDLNKKTLGVIGAGKIGQNVIKMAKAFDMKVLVLDPIRNTSLQRKLGFTYAPLKTLLKNSDIITIHAPLNKHTQNLINLKNINQIKKGAYLINTARGSIVDTTALIKALDKKILAGAALDVLEGEKDVKEEHELLHKKIPKENLEILKENHRLLRKRNVIITPHIAFYTKGAINRILCETISCIKSYKKGKIKNKVF